ncbi:MAG TPA: DUF4271 domain-containing protein [Chitinophagaceae bacterium]|nr:DUF4271 domain-containing protein [Chitinophagaceae bacterium]
MPGAKNILSFFLLLFVVHAAWAQEDTVRPRDTLARPDSTAKPRENRDSIVRADPERVTNRENEKEEPDQIEIVRRPATSHWRTDSLVDLASQVLRHHPYFGFGSDPVRVIRPERRVTEGREVFFYAIILLLLLYALIRRTFPRYFEDLFRLFFRTTIKQRQIKEQLLQNPLPSILLNAFFVISGGFYLSFLIEHFGINPAGNFWLLYLYCMLGLATIYLVKFLGLKATGWVFGARDAADSYLFVVFMINKMAGLLLLPFVVLLAFTAGDFRNTVVTLSFALLAGLLAYRFILTYSVIRNQVKVNPFHFFLYLCAFEIAPVLLVYKALLIYFRISA